MKRALSAREEQSFKVRDSLLKACGELMVLQPIDAITINEIVERAGVGKGSFYNHFPDKLALATTVSNAILADVEVIVQDCNKNVTDPAYRVVRGMCTHMQMAVSEPQRATIMIRGHDWATSDSHPLYKNVSEDISKGIDSGRFAKRCEDVGILQIVGTGSFCMIRIIERQLSPQEAIELAIKAFSLTLYGFGLSEEEAVRIVTDSAHDIIKG